MRPVIFVNLALAAIVLLACSPTEPVAEPRQSTARTPAEPIEDPVVARVGDTFIHKSDVIAEALAQRAIGNGETLLPNDPVFEQIAEELVDQRLLAMEARRRGLENNPVARERLAIAEERILGNVLLETVIDEAVTEDAITRVYNEQASLSGRSDEVRARHIQVETREEIDAVMAQLESGADFAELAVLYSEDLATQMQGGDLGFFSRQSVLPAFSSVAFSLSVGEVSEPFESPSGWHVMRVDSRRAAETPELAEVRPGIVRFLTFEQIENLVRSLRETTEIERFEWVDPELDRETDGTPEPDTPEAVE